MLTKHLKRNSFYKVFGTAVAVSTIYACSGSTTSTPATSTTETSTSDTTTPAVTPVAAAYSGPGSKWDFDLAADGSFAIEHRAGVGKPIDMTISGTYERLDSGFVKLVVGSSTGDTAPASGDEAWGLEIPGYAFLVKPMQADSDQIIAMVSAGSCPSGDFNANWVIVKQEVGRVTSDPEADYIGTFLYNADTSSPELPAKYSLTDPTTNLGSYALGAGDCTDGILSVDSATLYLTDNGGAIVHVTGQDQTSEEDDSFIFALGQKAIVNISNLDGEYVGMIYDEIAEPGSKVLPVGMTCVTGTCTGSIVTNTETGETDANNSVTVVLTGTVDTPETGMITGTISDDTTTGALSCMADTNASGSGRKIVSCVGQAPGDLSKMFNVIFVSK